MTKMLNQINNKKGYTLIELLVTLGIFITLSSLAYVSVSKLRATGDNIVSLDKLYADLKQVQIDALLGKKGGVIGAPAPRGIKFNLNSSPPTYVVFECESAVGCTYPTGATSLQTVELPKSYSLESSSTLPNSQILFAPLTSEVVDYSVATNTLVIKNITTNEVRTMTFNKFGTITVN